MKRADRYNLVVSLAVMAGAALAVIGLAYSPSPPLTELPGRLPEPPPYRAAEASTAAPPFEKFWQEENHSGRCQSCHADIFAEWNGSMMSNAWRDPAWRGAYLLSARQTSTDGNCGVPHPPDGSPRASHNPFAGDDVCSSTFSAGSESFTLSRPGSLLDGFCARCHMPSNYIDNIPAHQIVLEDSGMEHGGLDLGFDPTSDNGTGIAFAALEEQYRNTESGKSGIFCAFCHSIDSTRPTPFHNFPWASEAEPASSGSPAVPSDVLAVPDPDAPNLGYAVGAGSFRLSPRVIASSHRLGPLLSKDGPEGPDGYLSGVFGRPIAYETMESDDSKHLGSRQVLLTRAEFCGACHDVTNPLTIVNDQGRWVGGFPIERTYTEWGGSRYAERPGNASFDPAFKRDCQTCHMQQGYGRPGTAQTVYQEGLPRAPLSGPVASDAPSRAVYSTHHFIGGNAYISRLIGAGVDEMGSVQPYPELSNFSFTSSDPKSLYYNAYWTNPEAKGPPTQHSRLAWDRLRNVLELTVSGPDEAAAGSLAPLRVSVANSGSGHKFPTGFPEGRTAWVALRAFDLATGRELEIHDSQRGRTSLGVGYLTRSEQADPNFPDCAGWSLPAGSADPHAVQFKAIASKGDGCPTLDLVYAHPINMVVNADGHPIDATGKVIDRENPRGRPRFRDLDGDGDLFDDAYLSDTRLRPMPHEGASQVLDRYSVVVPEGLSGPVAVTAAVYYQSLEAVVAKKFLGNLADRDTDFVLEPCVLRGPCDGRRPQEEPPAVEGAPPVPMEVRNWVIGVRGVPADREPPRFSVYPGEGVVDAHRDAVVKVVFSEPVTGVDAASFHLADSGGRAVPAFVDQIGDGVWGLFAHRVFLQEGETYTARVEPGVCDFRGNCTTRPVQWSFRVAPAGHPGRGDSSIPLGFGAPSGRSLQPPRVLSVEAAAGGVTASFSEPVMNVHSGTVRVFLDRGGCGGDGAPVAGRLQSNAEGDRWTFQPARPLEAGRRHCLKVTSEVYGLTGLELRSPHAVSFRPHSAEGGRD